jgi:predicted metal-dependent hydrolase
MKIYSFVILCLFYFLTANAQTPPLFAPTKHDSLFFENDYNAIEARYKNFVSSISGANASEFKEIYKDQFESLKNIFTKKEVFTNKEAQNYLLQIANHILSKNKSLISEPINIFFLKSEIPNASYIGNRTILFNTGLFYKLQNESQVAFVICHELAHLYLDHTKEQIENYVNKLYSKEFQERLRKIKNKEYFKKQEFDKLVLSFAINSNKHSRLKENEADSLGMQFLLNTDFDANEAIEVMKILDKIDIQTFDTEAFLKTNFSFPDLPFNSRWLEKEEGLLGGHTKLKQDTTLADSLKTHPDCIARIKNISKAIPSYKQLKSTKSIINASLFSKLQKSLCAENIEFYIEKGGVSIAFYTALLECNQYKDNLYYIATINRCLKLFYLAQKNHKLNSIAMLPSPQYQASFNTVLQFIQNLYLDDFKEINNKFAANQIAKHQQEISFVKTIQQSIIK